MARRRGCRQLLATKALFPNFSAATAPRRQSCLCGALKVLAGRHEVLQDWRRLQQGSLHFSLKYICAAQVAPPPERHNLCCFSIWPTWFSLDRTNYLKNLMAFQITPPPPPKPSTNGTSPVPFRERRTRRRSSSRRAATLAPLWVASWAGSVAPLPLQDLQSSGCTAAALAAAACRPPAPLPPGAAGAKQPVELTEVIEQAGTPSSARRHAIPSLSTEQAGLLTVSWRIINGCRPHGRCII